MTPSALLSFLYQKSLPLTLSLLFGLILGFLVTQTQPTTYESRIFVSLGVKWETDSPPLLTNEKITENFSETLLGIIQAGEFTPRLQTLTDLPQASCSASTYEKSNLLLTCPTTTPAEAEKISKTVPTLLRSLLEEYNSSSTLNYTLAHTHTSIQTITPSLTKNLLTLSLLTFLLTLAFLFSVSLFRGDFWHKSQLESLLSRPLGELNPNTLKHLKNEPLAFLGEAPPSHPKALSLPRDLPAFNPSTHTLILPLHSLRSSHLSFLVSQPHDQIRNLKIFTINLKQSKIPKTQ